MRDSIIYSFGLKHTLKLYLQHNIYYVVPPSKSPVSASPAVSCAPPLWKSYKFW